MDKEQLKGALDLIILAHVSREDAYGGDMVKKSTREVTGTTGWGREPSIRS